MFTSILLLIIPFLTIAFLPMAIKTGFSSDELVGMGVCLEDPEAASDDYPFQGSDPVLPNMTMACCSA